MASFLKRRKLLKQKQPSKGFFKKGLTRNFTEFTSKHVLESPFLIKLNSVDLQLLSNETLAQVFSCEFCKIRKNTFFAEHHQATASDYRSINISNEGRIGKQNCK